jgi:hypothetical protein
MCFYLYAPRSKISIEYANEIITFLPDGSSKIQLEFLLENQSPTTTGGIEDFFIIYPNVFLKEDESEMLRFDPDGKSKNITKTLRTRELPENAHYTDNDILDKDFVIDENDETTIIESGIDGNEYRYKGKAIDTKEDNLKVTFSPEADSHLTNDDALNYDETLLLLKNKLTHFKFKMQKELLPSQKRWIRLYFNPKCTTAVKYLGFRQKLSSKLAPTISPYQIQGMTNLILNLKEKLKDYKTFDPKLIQQGKKRLDAGRVEDVRLVAGNVYRKLVEKGFESTGCQTTVQDWRITIKCDSLRMRILSTEPTGDIKTRAKKLNRKNCDMEYEFCTGEKYGKPSNFDILVFVEKRPSMLLYCFDRINQIIRGLINVY